MSAIHPQARISLVGAGPGDPELLTLKAVKTIQQADIILYDSLANEEILAYNPYAHKVYVGKRYGRPSRSQDAINRLLLKLATQGRHIVRLKGGDPMVFGRAMDEILLARQHGIPVEVVAGISAFSGMAANLQLPITERGVSRGFWVVTGTTKDGLPAEDLALAAQSSATVIVYMGLHQLPQIVATFRQYQSAELPVCIIQNATLPSQRTLIGNLGDIVQRQAQAGLSSPALLIFGAAAAQVATVNPAELAQIVQVA